MSPIIRRLHLIRDASRAGNLSGYEGLLLRELSDHIADQNDTIGWFIKQTDLAAECGIGVRTTNRTLGNLMRRGLVEAEERGKRKSLRYYINEAKLAALGQGDTANEAQSERRSPTETTPERRNGHSQGGVTGTAKEAYGLRLGGVADSSQLLPKTPPDELLPMQAAPSPPQETEEEPEDARSPLATKLGKLTKKLRLKESSETDEELAELFRDLRPSLIQICEDNHWPLPTTSSLLEDLAYLAVNCEVDFEDNRYGYGRSRSLGSILAQDQTRFKLDFKRLTATRVLQFLEGYADQIARGHAKLEEFRDLTTNERTWVDAKAQEKYAYYHRDDNFDEEKAYAEFLKTLPQVTQ